MNFATAIKNESRKKYTENGAQALNSTGEACLDMFGSIGALRKRNTVDVERIYAEAYKDDALLATKILFYARDIRQGCGERKTFRTLLHYAAKIHPESIRPNIALIGEYGRYDDLYELIDTPLEDDMWAFMSEQLTKDVENCNNNKPVSLLAKWVKTADASSDATRKLGIKTAIKCGYQVRDFKRIIRKLRKYIDIVEAKMSANNWDQINYETVPSRAMHIYKPAFRRHDEDRFKGYIESVAKGEAKINAGTLYPYDIVSEVLYKHPDATALDVLNAQWDNLPNYVEEGTNAMVIADVSGSMSGQPMASSIGLALYFAERNTGAYQNLFMTFSDRSDIIRVEGETLQQKIQFIHQADWGGSTNLEAAFDKVLQIAIDNHVAPEEMIKSLIVVSDMEINNMTRGTSQSWTFYDSMRERYREAGYEIPNVVFWNVDARNDTFHADSERKGVQLCSGSSATTFKHLADCIGMTPIEMMLRVINSERYAPITVE